jgi:gliding motility-associated-like protein
MKKIMLLRISLIALFAFFVSLKGYSQCFSPGVTMTVNVTEPLCYGTNTGTIEIIINGGNAPYTYSLFSDTIPDQTISKAIPTHTFTNLPPGNYLVATQVSLGIGFTFCTQNVSISTPSEIQISGLITPATCNGGNNGSIDVSVNGGTPSYTYSWSNGATSEDIGGLTAQTYTLTVTDNFGCPKTANFTVTEPTALNPSATITDVSCNGGNDGAVNLTVSGGTAPYTYSWAPGGSTSEDIAGLTAGAYTVTITDFNNCQTSATYNVNQPPAITLSGNVTDASCPGLNDGVIDLSVNGGTAPYTYSWSNGATSKDISNLTSGPYTITVTDFNGCQEDETFNVSEPPPIAINEIITDVTCAGLNDGAIDLTLVGGTPPYSFSWSNGATTEDISDLAGGSYTVDIEDANLCVLSVTYTVNEPLPLSLSESITDALCFGVDNGSIDLTVNGGTAPYSYSWSNGQTTQDIAGLSGGAYSVTVTDFNGCQISGNYNVNQPQALLLSGNVADVDCNGNANGAIDLTVNGGTAPYAFSWSNGMTTEDISGLSPGSYSVDVTDNNGCTNSTSFNIAEPPALSLSGSTTDVSPCNGDSNGAIDLTVNGGALPYSFSWSNGATTEDLSGLTANSYSVTVTDNNGCQQTANFTINEPPAISITGNTTDVTCNGGNNGAIDITVNNGTAPFSYSWSNGATTEDIGSLTANSYSVTVTDNNGCQQTASFTINEPTPITLSESITDASCLGINDGAIDLTVNGGVPPYSYSWSNGDATQDISGLAGGSYTVTVTDQNNCQQSATYNIIQPPALTLSANITDILCNGDGNGAIDLTVAGGTAPFIFNWSTGDNSEDINGLSGGSYSVTVTDDNGCFQNATYTVNEPPVLTLSGADTDISCFGADDGAVDLTVNGGTAPYTYSWSNGETTEDLSGLSPGNYSVTVTDNNGCQESANFDITEPLQITINGVTTDVDCNGAITGAIDITVNNGAAPLSFSWSNGATTEDLSGVGAGNYTVTVTDNNGCEETANFSINEPPPLSVSGSQTDIICNSGTTGAIDLTVNGGTAPYTFNWSNGETTEDISGLGAGNYDITVTDNNGCQQTASFTITEPSPINISSSVTNLLCNGDADGAIDIDVTGGTAPYTYSWDNGSTNEDITGLTAGPYTVTVTDAANCIQASIINVSEPLAITLSANVTDASCLGVDNGSIDLTINGGTLPYSISWDNGLTTEDLSNLAGGSYTVTVTDGNGCSANGTYNINQPSNININGVETDLICNGTGTGEINITIAGGTAPYNITWSNGETTEDIANLAGGVYSVTVTDQNGCMQSASYTIDEPGPIVINGNANSAFCVGMNDGSIDIDVTGGTPVYSYSWMPNGETTEDLSGLASGSYTVTVTDQNNCIQTATFDVTVTLTFDITLNILPAVCNGNSDGSIEITSVTGGTAPYTYSFEGSPFGNTVLFTGLAAGNYILTVMDDAGCRQDSIVDVTEPADLSVTATFDSPICAYNNDGEVTLSGNGGTPAYLFSTDNISFTSQTVYSGLNPGTYRYYIRDNNGCTDSTDATLAPHPQVDIAAINAAITHLTCAGVNTGSIALSNITGGTEPYTFSLNRGTPQSSPNYFGLAAGGHTINIIDAFGCNNFYNFTINSPPPIDFNLTLIQYETCDFQDGIFRFDNVSGGISPYTYRFNGGAPVAYTGPVNFTNLASGTYSVTVIDNANPVCSITKSIDLPRKPGPMPYIRMEDVRCFGGSDGMIIVDSVQGGVPLFDITVFDTLGYSNTITNVGRNDSISFTGLLPHLYGMTIRDQECTYGVNAYYLFNGLDYDTIYTDSMVITQPGLIRDSIVTFNTDRYRRTGSAVIHGFSGGTPGFSYSFDDATYFPIAGDSLVINNLHVGRYIVYIRDSHWCLHIDTLYVGADLYIPNLITPNGDNHNDTFEIFGLPENSQLRVYNRWGSRVYTSKNYDNLWAGNGEPDGIYYFDLILPDGSKYKGWVEIVR